MPSHPQAQPVWKVSSHCNNGSCVEVAAFNGRIMVRDNKEVDGPILRFSHDEWTELIESIKRA
jgi:hypothetical protein